MRNCSQNLAGWQGLAAARTYLQLNSSANVVLFDSASTVGGVWAKERLYPTLRSNKILGSYEYSDFPMTPETYGVQPGQHIPGIVVHRYLEDYAKHSSVYNRIRFNTKVDAAEHQDVGGWIITLSRYFDPSNATHISKLFTAKLIVATGLTSDPFLPYIPGSDTFDAPFFHSKDLLTYVSTLDASGPVCVLGGTKSAWDVVYAYAFKGRQVEWIIRESGHEPVWISQPYVTPLKKLLEELLLIRFLTWFSPCVFGFADGYRWIRTFLHKTVAGRFIVDRFWDVLRNDLVRLNKLDSHRETVKLKPWTNPFFIGVGLSIWNYSTDIYECVRNGTVKVHISDIERVGRKKVILTRWKVRPPLHFSPKEADLGLPHKSTSPLQIEITEQADLEMLGSFPRLHRQPTPNPKFKPLLSAGKGLLSSKGELQSYQLYRIAFSGCLMTISTALCAQTQALWIAAYFNKQVSLSQDMNYVTILHSRYAKWRSPVGFGASFPDLAFDSLPY